MIKSDGRWGHHCVEPGHMYLRQSIVNRYWDRLRLAGQKSRLYASHSIYQSSVGRVNRHINITDSLKDTLANTDFKTNV